jgi:hypothetical protein
MLLGCPKYQRTTIAASLAILKRSGGVSLFFDIPLRSFAFYLVRI